MEWLKGTYKALHPGASGGNSDPDGWELYTGGDYPTWRQIYEPHEVNGADFKAARHVYKQVPAAGRAASVPPEIPGVPSNDRPHSLALDGHQDSEVSSHPDGRFAQNTAATSDHSLGANTAHFAGPFPGGGLHQAPDVTGAISLDANLEVSRAKTGVIATLAHATPSQLFAQRMRAKHLEGQPELLVKKPSIMPTRVLSALEAEWGPPALGLAALGLYVAYSILAT